MFSVLSIARNDLRVFLKDRGNLIGLLFIPIVMTFVIGMVGGGSQATRLRVDVINNDNSPESQQFLADLREINTSLVLCPFDNDKDDFCGLNDATTLDEAQAATRLKEQTSLALIEIPANFTADVKAGKNVAITYRSNEDITAPSYILQAVQAAVQRMNGAVVASRVGASVADGFKVSFKDDADRAAFAQSIYDRAAQLWSQNPIKVSYITSDKPTESSTTTSSPSGFGQSVPGMGAMFVMFTVFAGMQVLIVERKNWTLQRLVTMPITRAQLLGGKILARFATGIIQFLVVLAVGMIMRVNLGSDLLAFALLIVMYTLSITAFSFALAPRLRTEQQAGSLSLLLSMVLAPLGGAWFPLDLMPQWMRVVGHVSPVAWAMEGFNNLVFNGGSLSTVLVQLAALVIFTVVFFIIGIRSFEYE